MADRSAQGRILTRCRRCGAIGMNLHTPDVLTTVISLTTDTRDPNASGISPRLIDIHACRDGNFGIADAIGGEFYGNVPAGRYGYRRRAPRWNGRSLGRAR